MKDTRKNILSAVMIFAAAFMAFALITMVCMSGTFMQAVCTPIPWLLAMICSTAGFVIFENDVNFDSNMDGRVFQ